MDLTLHGYFRSSCSWRVRIALHHKGLSWEDVSVHLVKDGGQQHADAHQALNPMREVPVLFADGEALAQSMAILEFLEETHPEPAMLPTDPVGRARVRQLAECINAGIQPIQNLRVMQHLAREHGWEKPATIEWSRYWIHRGFEALERLASEHSGACLVGDSISYADACFVPQMYNARRFNVDLSAFPTLVGVDERLMALPAFAETHPSCQPDTPEDLRS